MQANRLQFLKSFTRFVRERSAAGIVNAEISIYKEDFIGVFYASIKSDEANIYAKDVEDQIVDKLWEDYKELAQKWVDKGKRPTWGADKTKSVIGNTEMRLCLYGNQEFARGPMKGKVGRNLPTKNWVENVVRSFRRNVNRPLEREVNKHEKVLKLITAEHGTGTAAGGGQRQPPDLIDDFESADIKRLPGGKGNVAHTAIVKALKSACRNGEIKWFTNVVQDYNQYVFSSELDKRKTAKTIMSSHVIKIAMIPNSKQHGGDDKQVIESTKRYFGRNFKKIVKDYIKKNLFDQDAIDKFNAASPKLSGEMAKMQLQTVLSEIYQTTELNPNMRLRVNKKMAKAVEAERKRNKGTIYTKAGAVRHSVKKAVFGTKPTKKRPKGKRGVGKTAESPIALRNLLNDALPQMVASKMTGMPTLQFRTGRFANSARVENVNIGPRGGIGVDYTYQKDPYEVFEPGQSRLASMQRDPQRLIGQSIREIAIGILGKQPRTIRRT